MTGGDLRVGACYCVRGGHVLRYVGPYREAHFFTAPSQWGLPAGAGTAIAIADVLFEFTRAERPWLARRIAELEARNLHADAREAQLVLDELTAGI